MELQHKEKQNAFIAYKKCHNERTLTALKSIRSNTKRITLQCANENWQQIQRGARDHAELAQLRNRPRQAPAGNPDSHPALDDRRQHRGIG